MVRTKNLLELRNAQLLLQDRAKQLEAEVKEATMEITERELESLMVLGKTAEFKDPETAHHVARVANYSKLLAKKYNLSQDEQDAIFYASPFHDIGKVGIRDEILLKPAKLTNEEFEIMKTHSAIGYEILKDTKSKYLQLGASIALYHHEKYDGNGYPHGLEGEDIPIEARIVAVADVFDALVSKRPYKKAWSYEDAIELLKSERAKHFDPKLLNIFIDSIDEIKKINQKYNQ
jgi:response regulator RpfG family c-di-GMP phosphodiesterase